MRRAALILAASFTHRIIMKKYYSILLFSLLLASQVMSQTITNYTFEASAGTFTPITGGTVKTLSSGSLDDGAYNSIPIGFDFTFLGRTGNTCSATTNGVLSLENVLTTYYGNSSLLESVPLIVPLGDDNHMNQGSLTYKSELDGMDSVFTIEWLNVKWRYSATNPGISFQVKLYKNSGKISFIYRQEAGLLQAPRACIGISKGGSSSNRFLSLSNTSSSPSVSSSTAITTLASKPATGQVYSFTPVGSAFNVSVERLYQTSVTLKGRIDNGVKGNTAGFVIGTSADPVIGRTDVINTGAVSPVLSGTYMVTAGTLSPSTKYYYRAYIHTINGTAYGTQDSFTTPAPSVPALTVSGIPASGTQALFNGTVLSNGGAPLSASGIVYSTLPSPVLGGTGTITLTTTPVAGESYTLTAAGLTNGTKYYFAAFATNSLGTAYCPYDSVIMIDPVSVFPYTQRFDGTAYTGWTTSGTVNDWEKGSAARLGGSYSAPNAWITKLVGAYRHNHDGSLVSPVLNFSGLTRDPVLEFRHQFYTQERFDGGMIEVSVNNGPWTQLNPAAGSGSNYNTSSSVSWYNSMFGEGSAVEGSPVFSGYGGYYESARNNWILTQTPLTGVAGHTNVRFRFRFVSDDNTAYNGWAIDDVRIFLPTAPLPMIRPVTGLGNTFVTLSDTVFTGGSPLTAKGFVVGTSPNPVIGGTDVINIVTNPRKFDGIFSTDIGGLDYPVKYYYKAYATNAFGTTYSGQDSFITLDRPTIDLSTMQVLTDTSAYVSADISYTATVHSVVSSGVLLSTSPAPAEGGAGVINIVSDPVVSNGLFGKQVNGLARGTRYYYRFYAKSSTQTFYSSESNFTTYSLPSVSGSKVNATDTTTAMLSGNVTSEGGTSLTEKGIVIGTSANPEIGGTGVIKVNAGSASTGAYTVQVNGLTPGTVYYFRAFATNAVGTSYGSQETFMQVGTVTAFPYQENFDSITAYSWYSKGTGSNDWEMGMPAKTAFSAPYSGTKAWVTKLSGSYSNSANAYIQSPVYDFSAMTHDPILEFRHRFLTESHYDGGLVEYSTNGGITWALVDSVKGTGDNFNTANSLAWYNSTESRSTFSVTPRFTTGTSSYGSVENGWIHSSSKLTGLAGMSKVRLRFRFISDGSQTDEGWMIDDVKVYMGSAPALTAVSAINITNSTAVIGGTLLQGPLPVTGSGIVYGTTPNPAIGDAGVTSLPNAVSISQGTFSQTLSGLNYPVTYYYRAYAINAIGTGYSVQDSFTTPDIGTITHNGYGDLIDTAVILYGNISYSGSGVSTVTGSGVLVSSTNNNPVAGGVGVQMIATAPVVTMGGLTIPVQNLTVGTRYFTRFYITNSFGTFYSNVDSFTTPKIPVVVRNGDPVAGFEQAVLKGRIVSDRGEEVRWSGVVVSESSNPYVNDAGAITQYTSPVAKTGEYTLTVTGLTRYHKYYYRFFAINDEGEGYSAQDSFIATEPVSTLPYNQNFDGESSNAWTEGSISGNVWEKGAPSKTNFTEAYSAPNAWVTKLTGDYAGNVNTYLLSPVFNMTGVAGDPILEFRHKFLTESVADGGVIEVSVDGGSWTILEASKGTGSNFDAPVSLGWYNENTASGPLASATRFSGSSTDYSTSASGWILSKTRLTGVAGHENVRLRFRFVSDNTTENEGWMIDDLSVYELMPPETSASDVKLSTMEGTSATVSWTNGSGNDRIVTVRPVSATVAHPANWTAYAASAVYAAGDSTGTLNYVVYNGNGNTVTVTGIDSLTDYIFTVYEYNGSAMHVKYTGSMLSSVTTRPVDIVSFTAKKRSSNVSLEWRTSKEKNNRGFDIERSVNNRTFRKITFVAGKGPSTDTLAYTYSDKDAFTEADVLYYRLKQMDSSGRVRYSNVVTVSIPTGIEDAEDAARAVTIAPNPFSDQLGIYFTDIHTTQAQVMITDVTGREVFSGSYRPEGGKILIDELSGLQSGVYYIRISTVAGIQTYKTVKQ
jgi:hypothetical protein